MPSLICSSRYTIDSQILRRAAQQLGWETLRLDGNEIPEWFDPPDDEIAFFHTAPHAFEVAKQLDRKLLGCAPNWTVQLPREFLKRELRQTTLALALQIEGSQFVKHSLSKAFPAAVYDRQSLLAATEKIPGESLVHVGEPVNWTHEYRCFVVAGRVVTVSPYLCNGEFVKDYESFPELSDAELTAVTDFAEGVLNLDNVASPPAFVLDVGQIAERGWAVVECNECWASGIYACDPVKVLTTLLAANCELDSTEHHSWEFADHYFSACAKISGGQ